MSDETIRRNLHLVHAAVLAIAEHAETRHAADELTQHGALVLFDQSDIELSAFNHAMADEAEQQGRPIVRLQLQTAPSLVEI